MMKHNLKAGLGYVWDKMARVSAMLTIGCIL